MRTPQCLTLFSLLVVLPYSVAAQENEPATVPGGLAIQIMKSDGSAPAFLSVPPANAKPTSVWMARFEKVAGFQPEPGTPPVRAVNFVASGEGDAARVFVSVFVGVRYFDKELQVGSYLLREGESAVVKDLTAFGVQPFEITVVKPNISPAPLPSVLTKTNSLEVIGLEPTKATIPTYKLSLRNLSTKNIAMLQVNIYEGARLRLAGSPRGKEGLPLISPGAVLETRVLGAQDTTVTRFGYQPTSPPYQTVVVTTLVFEDGSYEGDPEPALRFNARTAGEKLQLARAIAAMKQALDQPGLTASESIAMLIQSVSALNDAVPPNITEKLIEGRQGAHHPETLESLKGTIRSTMNYVKKNLLDEIHAFQNSREKAPGDAELRAWLTATFERYSEWRLRLR